MLPSPQIGLLPDGFPWMPVYLSTCFTRTLANKYGRILQHRSAPWQRRHTWEWIFIYSIINPIKLTRDFASNYANSLPDFNTMENSMQFNWQKRKTLPWILYAQWIRYFFRRPLFVEFEGKNLYIKATQRISVYKFIQEHFDEVKFVSKFFKSFYSMLFTSYSLRTECDGN